jgi:very-short-patch-repair endonuclease
VHPVDALHLLGGVATYGALIRLTDRAALEARVATGDIVRDARGRYALAAADEARRAANAVSGVVSHLSAATHWGWQVKLVPERPHVTVPRNRNLARSARRLVVPHWATLAADDVVDLVTTRERTLADCLRTLPVDEGLAVADSALRHGDVSAASLLRIGEGVTGPGAARARFVARHADGRAANPFESVLRCISLELPGLHLRPQLRITAPGFFARPDLVDRDLMVVVEADSNTWHNASRSQLRRDCRRYTGLVVRGWLVARFAWEDVMFEPDYVRTELCHLVVRAEERAERRPKPRRSAPRGVVPVPLRRTN